ncbi:MAG: outer membrane lipoprotein LolB [Pseudomonadales bacterium]|nr:outer membrane lipoprotein LolB [Pseudomonadales bacterium]
MRKVIILAACLTLSACAQFQSSTRPSDSPGSLAAMWSAHIKQLENLEQWGLTGRIGSRTTYRANSASIQWQQDAEHFKIHLSGPFGQGSLTAEGTSKFITLHSATTGKITSNNPQQLLDEQLGWVFPLSKAKNWVIGNPGKPRHDLEKYTLDDNGRMKLFTDSGWEINYHNYRKTGNIALPHKVVLKHRGTKIVIIIKSWKT